jgi:hypothetical protein
MKGKGISPKKGCARVRKVLKIKSADVGRERKSLEDIEKKIHGAKNWAGRKLRKGPASELVSDDSCLAGERGPGGLVDWPTRLGV